MSFIEIANLIVGTVVAGVALYAAQQVRIMKRDIRIRNERAAKEKAIEFCVRYTSIYTPYGHGNVS